jgi:excisionase family DNA binding protein
MKLVTVKVISEMLMVSPSTVYQWAETSAIPCYKINGALRFSEKEVFEWIMDCKRDPLGSKIIALRPIAPERRLR